MVRPAAAAGGPTLAVIAREAGVSVPTASKVANGREDVAPETRRRVTEVLDRLGYVRRQRISAGRGPALIELVMRQLDSPWSGAVLHGVERAAREAGVSVLVSAAPAGGARGAGGEHGWLERLCARETSGMLFNLAGLSEGQYSRLRQHGIPFVMIDPVRQPPPWVPSVGATNWQGGVSATEHLIGLGHRRIAVIGGFPREQSSTARVAGHRSAMAAAGLPVPPGYVGWGEFSEEGGRREMERMLALPDPPTAVFSCSDEMGLGVCRALAGHGLRVPEEVSLVAFDDLPQARWATPALTTVRQPLAEMAGTALRLLLRMVAGDRPEGVRTELSTRLVVRDSTAPPGGRA
ncbi:LacI family DNA-binding transcriptional regulator [Streptomyces harbinensis]|uniref:LacI family DNA-binding transcriptional regulator n=1 Tax=Streptomyces harbinensis TaxID=1176198 RepID=UPI0036A1AE6A